MIVELFVAASLAQPQSRPADEPVKPVAVWEPGKTCPWGCYAFAGRFLYLCGEESIRVYDLTGTKEAFTLQTNLDKGTKWCAASPDGTRLVAMGGQKGKGDYVGCPAVEVWDLEKREVRHAYIPAVVPKGRLFCVAPDNTTVIIPRTDKVTLCELATGKEIVTWKCGHLVNSMAVSPDGSRLATGSRDGSIELWDLPKRKLVATTGQTGGRRRGGVGRLEFSADSKVLAASHDEQQIVFYHATTGEEKDSLPAAGNSLVFALSPDGKSAAAHFWEDREYPIQLWDVESRRTREDFKGRQNPETNANTIGFSSDGKRLATITLGSNPTKVWIWDVPPRKPEKKP